MTVYCAGRRQATAEMPQGVNKRTEEFPNTAITTTKTTTKTTTTKTATTTTTTRTTPIAAIKVNGTFVGDATSLAARGVASERVGGEAAAAAVVLNACGCCQQQQQQKLQHAELPHHYDARYTPRQQQQQHDSRADHYQLPRPAQFEQHRQSAFYVEAPAPPPTSSSALAYMLMAAATRTPPPPAAAAAAAAAHQGSAVAAAVAEQKRRRCWPPPLFIILISMLELGVFAYDSLTMTAPMGLSAPAVIPSESVLIYRPDRRLQLWRFLSYMFLHASWLHLALNVSVQLLYGLPLELLHGSVRVAFIYLAGVCAGALGTSVVDSEVYLVGASGGVYALLAAQVANCLINWGQLRYGRSQLVSMLVIVCCDIGYAVYTKCCALEESRALPGVSYVAHMTGALAGFTMGLLVLRHYDAQHAQSHLVWWLALGVYAAFTLFAIAFNLLNTMAAQRLEERGEAMRQHFMHDLGLS